MCPCFSADGRTLAFSRSSGHYHGDIYTLEFDENMKPMGEPMELLSNPSQLRGLAWSPDGTEIIYSAGPFPSWTLRRIKIADPDSPIVLAFARKGVRYPTISQTSNRLAYQMETYDLNLYRLDLDESGTPTGPPRSFESSSRIDWSVDYSPDGTQIVFSSDRDGEFKLFVCDRDGSNVFSIASARGNIVYEPSWSPDGNWIAFVARPEGHGDIYLVDPAGGNTIRLTDSLSDDQRPSWSSDSNWIYFSSFSAGNTTLKKISVERRDAVEAKGRELGTSTNGEQIYYAGPEERGVWAQSAQDDALNLITDKIESYPKLVNKRIYYVKGVTSPSSFSIVFFDLATGETREVEVIDKPYGYGFTVSPDARSIIYAQDDHPGSDLMLVENFQ